MYVAFVYSVNMPCSTSCAGSVKACGTQLHVGPVSQMCEALSQIVVLVSNGSFFCEIAFWLSN